MAEVVISEFMDEAAVREHLAGFDVVYDPKLVDSPDALVAAVRTARALIVRNRTQVRGPLLDAADRLTAVGRLGVGLDNIDVAACKARGVAVYPASGANDVAVAEYVVTAALVLLRRSWLATERVAAGAWPRMDLIGREVSGKCLGLVGFGAIARETARRAAALGMAVCAHDPFVPADAAVWRGVDRLDLTELLGRADVISLHVPLTPDTRNLIDAAAIARIKRGAVLVNTARGGIVDDGALAAALADGRLGGAAIDVYPEEPLTAAAGALYKGLPNLILTPHIAGVTEESNVRVSHVTAAAIARHLRSMSRR
jgi:(S)-sulfolactate dehydrogenase